jgi:hypothetical protein
MGLNTLMSSAVGHTGCSFHAVVDLYTLWLLTATQILCKYLTVYFSFFSAGYKKINETVELHFLHLSEP